MNFLYIISSGRNDSVYKLGISGDPEFRLEQIKRDYNVPNASIVETMDVPTREEVFAVENALHTRFDRKRARNYQGREWFKLTQTDLAELRSMCQEQSDAFAQCQAYFGLFKSSAEIEHAAKILELERQRQITYNRRHGKTYDTTPDGVLKRYNDLQKKLRNGTLGERFSFGQISHPTKKLLSEVVGEMEVIIQGKLKKTWLKLAVGGAFAGLVFGGGASTDDHWGLIFGGGVIGLISGGINQSARKDSEVREATELVKKAIEERYPGDLNRTLDTIKDKKKGSFFLVRDFAEESQQLRNESPRLPNVTLPQKVGMLRTISQTNMFPYSGTIVTLGLVGLIAGGLERPASRNRSELLGTFQLPQSIEVLESSTATAFGRDKIDKVIV